MAMFNIFNISRIARYSIGKNASRTKKDDYPVGMDNKPTITLGLKDSIFTNPAYGSSSYRRLKNKRRDIHHAHDI